MLIRPLSLFLIVAIPRIALAQPTFTANDFVCANNLFNAGDLRADYDGNGTLNANDLIKFQQLYASRDPRANCDGSILSTGWTAFPLPAGAQVSYVAANGTGSACTQANPCSLATGMTRLRAGQPDQVYLKCGDSFSGSFDLRGSGSNSTYQVIGAWGTGPRPKFAVNETVFYGGNNCVGMALVDLHLEYTGGAQNKSSMFFQEGCRHLLVEGCYIAKWGDGIVMHSVSGSGRITDVKIRRNIIVDTKDTDGRCQGVFFGDMDGLVMEENVLDYNGRSTGEQTIFMHNVYIHETCGTAVFNGNISTRATSHGLQERPGGQVINNFFAQNGVNCYQGSSAGGTNTCSYNVVIDGRNISAEHPRGIAYELSGRGNVEYNIAAHQVSGTDNVSAFGMASFSSGTIRGNFVYDWKKPGSCEGSSVQWDDPVGSGTITVTGNRFFMPSNGMINRHASFPYSSRFAYSQNTYFTTTPAGGGCGGYAQFALENGVGADWNAWRSRETNSTFLNASPTYNLTVAAYMTSLGLTGGLPEFAAQARLQSKQNWRTQFTSDGYNDWARARAGVPAN